MLAIIPPGVRGEGSWSSVLIGLFDFVHFLTSFTKGIFDLQVRPLQKLSCVYADIGFTRMFEMRKCVVCRVPARTILCYFFSQVVKAVPSPSVPLPLHSLTPPSLSRARFPFLSIFRPHLPPPTTITLSLIPSFQAAADRRCLFPEGELRDALDYFTDAITKRQRNPGGLMAPPSRTVSAPDLSVCIQCARLFW